jgi:uncharacterized membrane protein
MSDERDPVIDPTSVDSRSVDEAQGWPADGMRTSDLNMAMVHLYRAEVSRSNTWRQRLDMTTNWAVVTTAAAMSLAFSSPENEPAVIPIVTLLILLFLFIEARRYRYYELWAYRVRLLESNYFAEMLEKPFRPARESAERLNQHLRYPSFNISLLEALGRRYRRNYAPIFIILSLAWLVKVLVHPTPAGDLATIVERAAIGALSGLVVIILGVVFNLALILLGITTVGLRRTTSEVFTGVEEGRLSSLYRTLSQGAQRAIWEVLEIDVAPLHLPQIQHRKQLVFIVSDAYEEIGAAVIADMDRGVTLLRGTGMYTHKEHGILMVAVASRQVEKLRETVNKIDPKAFVMVSPLQDVRGEGFRPLEA